MQPVCLLTSERCLSWSPVQGALQPVSVLRQGFSLSSLVRKQLLTALLARGEESGATYISILVVSFLEVTKDSFPKKGKSWLS